MKKNKMEVQLRSYYRPGRSFNTLSNPSSKFKGNRNKKFVCNLKTKSGKISEGLECTDYLCFSSNLRYKALPGRGVPVPLPPPPQKKKIKIILFQKKLKICFLMLWCSPILHLFAPPTSRIFHFVPLYP